jgi:hypothetical protein
MPQSACSEISEESWLLLMPESERTYSTRKVSKAGKVLIDPNASEQARSEALEIFENWRGAHSFPMNWFHKSLTNLASSFANVVQRPKRLEAVQAKLLRKPDLQLGSMNDIAGVRAIVPSIDGFDRFVEKCRAAWTDHELKREPDDYITNPPSDTGYRSLHLVYRFKGTDPSFNGRLVEVQIRTREQHAWATAVETVDLIQGQSLKAGQGHPDWQRFFALMSSAMARRESRPLVPNTPTDPQELENELRRYTELLQVQRHLQVYGAITRIFQREEATSHFFLIEHDVNSKETLVKPYPESDVRQAYQDVAEAERAGKNVVLTAARNFEQLREAYPNWFSDTANFLTILNSVLGEDVHYHI